MRVSTVVAATAALALVTVGSTVMATGVSAAKKPVPRLVVVPSGSLRSKETVRVRGSNFVPKDTVYLVECLARARPETAAHAPSARARARRRG